LIALLGIGIGAFALYNKGFFGSIRKVASDIEKTA
jgi:hypothetical protein